MGVRCVTESISRAHKVRCVLADGATMAEFGVLIVSENELE